MTCYKAVELFVAESLIIGLRGMMNIRTKNQILKSLDYMRMAAFELEKAQKFLDRDGRRPILENVMMAKNRINDAAGYLMPKMLAENLKET